MITWYSWPDHELLACPHVCFFSHCLRSLAMVHFPFSKTSSTHPSLWSYSFFLWFAVVFFAKGRLIQVININKFSLNASALVECFYYYLLKWVSSEYLIRKICLLPGSISSTTTGDQSRADVRPRSRPELFRVSRVRYWRSPGTRTGWHSDTLLGFRPRVELGVITGLFCGIRWRGRNAEFKPRGHLYLKPRESLNGFVHLETYPVRKSTQ